MQMNRNSGRSNALLTGELKTWNSNAGSDPVSGRR
jgi:hypothetical protein